MVGLPMGKGGLRSRLSRSAARASLHVLVGSALGLAACSGDKLLGDYPPSTCDLAEPRAELHDEPLRIATFWTEGKEQDALTVLLNALERQQRYYGEPQRFGNRVQTQRHIQDAFDTPRLPDVFQVNGGSDVLRWVAQRSPENTDVCSLDPLRRLYHYDDLYFPATLDPLRCHGDLFGLPVGVHHLNVLFYNKRVFATLADLAQAKGRVLRSPAELRDPHQLVSFLEDVEALKAESSSRTPLVPLALGAYDEWPLTIVAFENVLLGLGDQAYEKLWKGGLIDDDGTGAEALDAKLIEMLDVLRSLAKLSNIADRVKWQTALVQVGSGDALMTITGDWGWAQLTAEARADVEAITFPGTAGTFVYTPDSFAVPRELKKDGSAARYFLHEVVENMDTLIDFSKVKFSIPPRMDLSESQLARLGSDTLRATYADFTACNMPGSGCKLLLAVSGLAPALRTNPCYDEIDSVLARAVEDSYVPQMPAEERICTAHFPETKAEGEARLLELLNAVAKQHFAAECR